MPPFQKKLHVTHRFAVDRGRRQFLHTRTKATLDVVLQTGPRMVARQIHLAGRDQEIAVNEVDNPIRKIGGEVGSVVAAAVLAQAAGYVHAREALSESELDVGIGLVVAEQNVEARLLLFDQVIFERERLFVVGDDDVVDVHRFAHQCSRLGVGPTAFVKIRTDPRAQVLRLADVDDFPFGVFVEINPWRSRQATNFLGQVHLGVYKYFNRNRDNGFPERVARKIVMRNWWKWRGGGDTLRAMPPLFDPECQ